MGTGLKHANQRGHIFRISLDREWLQIWHGIQPVWKGLCRDLWRVFSFRAIFLKQLNSFLLYFFWGGWGVYADDDNGS